MLALLLLSCAQGPVQEPAPFTFDLPAGYESFVATPARPGTWASRRQDGQARISVSHYTLGMPGAQLDAVLEDLATRQWQPLLKSVTAPSLERWTGSLSGLEAGGWEVQYLLETKRMAISQHLALVGDQMIVLLWEGPAEARSAMDAVFDSLVVPDSWLPLPAPTVDPARGMGGELTTPFPGSLRIAVDLRAFGEEEALEFLVTHDATALSDPTEQGTAMEWQLPPAATLMPASPSDGPNSVRYRLLLDEEHGLGNGYGITRLPGQSLAALDPLWLALPKSLAEAELFYAPPAWSLTVYHSAQLRALAAHPVLTSFNQDNGTMTSAMPELAAGQAWPFLILAEYQRRRDHEVDWWLRLDAKALTPEAVIRSWQALDQTANRLWGKVETPTLASFPYIGDRVLPGLLLLDEQRGWFDKPIDSTLDGEPRLVALARLVAQQRFGAHLHGEGTAAQFLERSLAEYATARLLEQCGLPEAEDMAAELRKSWKLRELASPPLPLPLSLLPVDDLYGPRRLLSFGPLVWQAIADHLGEGSFDAMLQDQLAAPSRWSCATLEAALQARQPDYPWEAFLRASLYGRELPQN